MAFEGGVAANPGMVRAFTDILDLAPGELVVPEYYNVVGAVGAARLAMTETQANVHFEIDRIQQYLSFKRVAHSGREALSLIIRTPNSTT